MSKFRSKSEKEVKITNQNTLDKTHRNIMNAFNVEEAELSVLTAECELLQEKIAAQEFPSTEEKKKAIETADSLKNKTTKFKKRKHKYILDNSNLIFKYFNMKKKTELSTPGTDSGAPISFNQQRVVDFFSKSKKVSTNNVTDETILDGNTNIISQYLRNVDENYIITNASQTSGANNTCVYCKQGKLIISDDDGYLVCDVCAASITYIPENEKQSYKEPPKEVGTFLYDRSNHFKEVLSQFQAKETTYISEVVIEKCKQQIKKERLTEKQLTYYKMREMLRNLGYDSKLYEHIPFIKNKLGVSPPILSRQLEMKLCKMFDETLVPFSKHQDDTRCNYIHYYFALYKMYELLGETRYAKDIPMLKEPGIFMSQDEIWKNICSELNWKFIPTSFDIVGGDI